MKLPFTPLHACSHFDFAFQTMLTNSFLGETIIHLDEILKQQFIQETSIRIAKAFPVEFLDNAAAPGPTAAISDSSLVSVFGLPFGENGKALSTPVNQPSAPAASLKALFTRAKNAAMATPQAPEPENTFTNSSLKPLPSALLSSYNLLVPENGTGIFRVKLYKQSHNTTEILMAVSATPQKQFSI